MSELLTAAPAPRTLRHRSAATSALVMVARCVRLSRRNVDALFVSLLLPVLLMLVFVYLFGGAIDTGTRYVTYVVPGVLVLCAGFGAAGTAVSVTTDLTTGVVDRFRSLDVSPVAILGGHVAASVVRNGVATVLVLTVAAVIGFRPALDPLRWLAAAGVLLLFLLAVSWLAAAAGLLARTPEAAGGFSFLVMFLPYPSSAFVPVETMPTWLHGFAENQPVTPVIESMRALLLGTPTGSAPGYAAAWCLGLLALGVALTAALFPRRLA
ncbi:ABC transporter permease [Micromonospora sp. SH-82]|uniref:ABC transporter permease n=1 Tax=Micromonospora sp. SH-82 TaxID=3132938 RepID=UPI003EB8EB1C